jgi:hypothetical protein
MKDMEIIHRFAEENMLVERYLLRELAGADLEDFERHMFECQICFDQVKAGQAFTENISELPGRRSLRMLLAALLHRVSEFWSRHVCNAGGQL